MNEETAPESQTPPTHEHEFFEGRYETTDKGIFVQEVCSCGKTRLGRKMGN